MVYLITLVLVAISTVQIYGFIRRKLLGESAVYAVLVGISLLYIYSMIFNWNIPGPAYIVEKAFEPVSKLVFTQYQGYQK